jgi:DNA-binding NtrC family response regulator
MPSKILVVDDDEDACELLQAGLTRQGYQVRVTTSPKEALLLAGDANEDIDVVLTDLGMQEMHGLELCERLVGARPDVPVIVITGLGSMETAISAMRAGAYDFVTKPVDSTLLGLSVGRAEKHRRLGTELRRLKASDNSSGAQVGQSAALRKVYGLVARVAPSDASVLVHGETGTGKELIARAIHDQSGRSGPFVAINCAAVPAPLLESELFGHARGAFTDAKVDRKGLFVGAQGGTIFLDEIGEMPVEVQPKLLRALQERKVRPVGSNQEIPFDARIIAATNRDLETEVHEKRFREDLYYRINVVKIDLPPLRERGNDVLALAQHFLEKFAKRSSKAVERVSPAVAEKLSSYDWPGNVRELENCMERAVALARFEEVLPDDLPERIQQYRAEHFVVAADDPQEIVPVDELERRYILRVLKIVGGNKSRAAQLLGLDRRTLYRKLEQYDARGQGLEKQA